MLAYIKFDRRADYSIAPGHIYSIELMINQST